MKQQSGNVVAVTALLTASIPDGFIKVQIKLRCHDYIAAHVR